MRYFLNFRTSTNTLIKDTFRLNTILKSKSIIIGDLNKKFLISELESNEWRKLALSNQVALNGSLDINLNLNEDLNKEVKRKKNWRVVGVTGISYFLVTLFGAITFIYFKTI